MKNKNRVTEAIEQTLFFSKWMLIPFYLGLMVALACFLVIDVKEVIHFLTESNSLNKSEAMMFILELIDMAMIAALVRMIVIGGYTSFVNKYHTLEGEKTSSGVLKVKLGTALIGVSSINLLQTFISCTSDKSMNWDVLQKQLIIHGAFLMGALVLSFIDYLHVKSEMIHITPEEQNKADKKEILLHQLSHKEKELTEQEH